VDYTVLGSLRMTDSPVRRSALCCRPGFYEPNQGGLMAANKKLTVSVGPPAQRLSGAERRAAQIELLSTKQAQLKQEAAERRSERASQNIPTSAPQRTRPRRRGSAR
jgi:hypothetical protein